MRESVFFQADTWRTHAGSQDLRDRVASANSGGSSARAAAKRFSISESTAIRWAQRLSAEGHAKARAKGGDRRSRLTEHRVTVLTLVAHGHWKTTTLVAALRTTGITAPYV